MNREGFVSGTLFPESLGPVENPVQGIQVRLTRVVEAYRELLNYSEAHAEDTPPGDFAGIDYGFGLGLIGALGTVLQGVKGFWEV